MNIAVVDIGSNSTRLLISSTGDDRRITELVRLTEVTRLGAGVDADGRLRADAIDRVLATLDRYRARIDAFHCERAIAVLTSAVRDAANGSELAALVGERYGLAPHVLSGEQEARLTYLGATGERDARSGARTLVIDIGGGSTELAIGSGRELEFRVSTQAGVVRQTERHLPGDPPPATAELGRLSEEVAAILRAAVPDRRRAGLALAIAVAGTATSLAAIAQQLDPYDRARVHGYTLTTTDCARMLSELSTLTLPQLRAIPGLHPDRAPTIVAGAAILREALSVFGLHHVKVSEHDILRGAVLGLLAGDL
ncbi:MAG: Ppx/GppA phosphatase family protein [Solirubrobacteraceae bacterium]